MHYVYLLRSISFPDESYIGMTRDLRARLQAHNAGESVHTSKYKPWNLVVYIAFGDKQHALDFERYLKSGSGRAFASKHFYHKL
ncbi:MAG TPA: GIY-YIG nuclease family protein [Methylomirabilota bacterium]|nr:GIY-YIG nuclease family protein [Methylomirabilota bacterium]